MGLAQREKGKRGERYFASLLVSLGHEAYRTAQRSGRQGQADIEWLPPLHCEVKVGARPNIQAALAQALRDCKDEKLPVVLSKRDRETALLTIRAADVNKFARIVVDALTTEDD